MHLINCDLQDGITSTQDGSTSTDTKPLPSPLLSQERSSNQQFPSPQQENTFYGNQSFTQLQQSNFCLQPQPPLSSFQPQLRQPQYFQHFSQQRVICEDDSYSLVRTLSSKIDIILAKVETLEEKVKNLEAVKDISNIAGKYYTSFLLSI